MWGVRKTACTLVSKQGKIHHYQYPGGGGNDYVVIVRPDDEDEYVEAFASRKFYPSVRTGDRLTLVRGWYLAWPRIRPLRTVTAGGDTAPPAPLDQVVSARPTSGKRKVECTVLSKQGQAWFQVFKQGCLAYCLEVQPDGEAEKVKAGARREVYDSVQPGDRLILRRWQGLWPRVEYPHSPLGRMG